MDTDNSSVGKNNEGLLFNFENLNDKELLAYLKDDANFGKKEEKIVNNSQPQFSGTTAKPSIFRYFAKDNEPNQSANSSLNVFQLGGGDPQSLNAVALKDADERVAASLDELKTHSLAEENAIRNVHSINSVKESNDMKSVLKHPERLEFDPEFSNALDELTNSVENIISNLPVHGDVNDLWQPFVKDMKQMSEKRERLLELEKMFDQTVDEMNALRQTMCTNLADIKSAEIERAKSLQARLQLATSLQEKFKAL